MTAVAAPLQMGTTTMAERRFRIAYAGLDDATWFLLAAEPSFAVTAAACIPRLLTRRTFHPANVLWRRAYRRYLREQRLPLAQRVLLAALAPMLTSAWRRYHRFFASVVREGAALLAFDDAPAVAGFLRAERVDLLVVNVWEMLPPEIIGAPVNGAVNVHPSRLPEHRGAVPTLMSLKNGDLASAVSYIVLEAGMDRGDLIGQHHFPIEPGDDWKSLEGKIRHITDATLVADIRAYLGGSVRPRPQPRERGSSTPRYHDYRTIRWDAETAADICNKVNLYPHLEPFDYCVAEMYGREVTFRRGSAVAAGSPRLAPGEVAIRGVHLHVGTVDAAMRCMLLRDISCGDGLHLIAQRRRHAQRPAGSREE